MSGDASIAILDRDHELAELSSPIDLDRLVPGRGPWEVELGFGKGRYLIGRAEAEPARRFLGVEIAAKYFRVARRRASRRRLANFLLIRGEALYLLTTALPRGFASVLHVYFPDPWPKARHQKRRLFDPESVDLLLAALEPSGRLCFATDFTEYGELVAAILRSHPSLEVSELSGPWPGGARTNYEAKYMAEGRPIVRLEARRRPAKTGLVHPAGRLGLTAALAPRLDPDEVRAG